MFIRNLFLLLVLLLVVSPLIQAQTYQWVHSEGGWVGDSSNKVIFDQEGNSYITGHFDTNKFGSFIPHGWPARGFYLAKYSKGGTLLWVKFGSDSYNANGTDLALDSQGNILVTGFFSHNLDLGEIILRGEHQSMTFLIKYSTEGQLIWSKVVEAQSSGWSSGGKMVIDREDNIYLSSRFRGQVALEDDIKVNGNPNTSFYYDIYLLKYNNEGKIQWATFASSPMDDHVVGMQLDTENRLYVALQTRGSNFIFGGNTYQIPSHGSVVLRCDTSGKTDWVQALQGDLSDIGLDEFNNLYITGSFYSTIDFGNGLSLASDAFSSHYLAKYRADKSVVWAKKFEAANPRPTRIVANRHQVYLAGSYTGYLITDKYEFREEQGHHIFVLKLNEVGHEQWIKHEYWLNERAYWDSHIVSSIALSPEGGLAVTGHYNSPSLIFDGNTINNNSGPGSFDLFLALLDDPVPPQCPVAIPQLTVNTPIICVTDKATLSASGFNPYQISWYKDGNLLLRSFNPKLEVAEAGEYHFSVYDGSSCVQQSNTIRIRTVEQARKELTLSPGPIGCNNQPIRIEAADHENYSYQWYRNGVLIPNQTKSFLIATENGNYYCMLQNEGTCHIRSDNTSLLFLPAEENFLPDTLYRCRNEVISLSPQDLRYQHWNFTWSTGETTFSIEVGEEGLYTLYLNKGDCSYTEQVWVKNYDELKIPNVITPNGDQWNEKFIIENLSEPVYLQIYNRWGSLVYENRTYLNTWTAEGLPDGVYYYFILDRQGCREKNGLKGWVQVLR